MRESGTESSSPFFDASELTLKHSFTFVATIYQLNSLLIYHCSVPMKVQVILFLVPAFLNNARDMFCLRHMLTLFFLSNLNRCFYTSPR